VGSKVFAFLALVAGFAALGDILRNPGGTQAAANGANSLLKTATNAAGGYQN
jgi:hypothetical protein